MAVDVWDVRLDGGFVDGGFVDGGFVDGGFVDGPFEDDGPACREEDGSGTVRARLRGGGAGGSPKSRRVNTQRPVTASLFIH
jgi:hypothetical protein